MPTTIAQGFEKLKENLQITSLQGTTVSTRQSNVRAAVKKELTTLDDFLTGSYKRDTLVAPLSQADIDIFVVLHSQYFEQNGQAALLDKVRGVIARTYPDTKISRAGQAVTIKFSDFYVDVVPGFSRKGGGYLIPDVPGKRWIGTDPKKHVELWTRRNSDKGGKFVPLIKMLKGWNKKHGELLRSFHLECIAYDVMGPYTVDYPTSVRYVLDQARNRVQNGVSDPAGYGGNVGNYLDTQVKKDALITKLKAAYDKAIEAENLAKESKISAAYDKWRVVFGDYFPAYG
ncbi:MAG: hypothetical protein JNL18_23070 [Planctomycetaceae bacterium]|nr:hypothetical protein [Planctomycetaceae bacterium]